MKLPKSPMIATVAAVASVIGLAVAAVPAQATSAVGRAPAYGSLSDSELAALPLTDRHLTEQEKANLATVLGAYHAAEGNSLDPAAFGNSFTPDGVFTSVVTNQSYRGAALRNVVVSTAALFPDVHRDLRSITVEGDMVTIQLHIQGTWTGPLNTPAGKVKPTGAKVDFPTDDFFHLNNGKIQTFDCLIGLSAEMSQMGIGFDYASAVAKG